jgi:flavin-dependent dehydrogenase
VGASPDTMLGHSRLVAAQITETGASAGCFPAHPSIRDPLAAPGWLACGTAALGFDPLCGEGAANATREAILGTAVIRAASQGADVGAVLSHYSARLIAGFRRHLEVCREFYAAGNHGLWWDQQIADLDRGLAWASERLARFPGFRYRLNGFSLEAVT